MFRTMVSREHHEPKAGAGLAWFLCHEIKMLLWLEGQGVGRRAFMKELHPMLLLLSPCHSALISVSALCPGKPRPDKVWEHHGRDLKLEDACPTVLGDAHLANVAAGQSPRAESDASFLFLGRRGMGDCQRSRRGRDKGREQAFLLPTQPPHGCCLSVRYLPVYLPKAPLLQWARKRNSTGKVYY